jgi:hypothetical protein
MLFIGDNLRETNKVPAKKLYENKSSKSSKPFFFSIHRFFTVHEKHIE